MGVALTRKSTFTTRPARPAALHFAADRDRRGVLRSALRRRFTIADAARLSRLDGRREDGPSCGNLVVAARFQEKAPLCHRPTRQQSLGARFIAPPACDVIIVARTRRLAG